MYVRPKIRTDIDVATYDKPGIVKPDGTSIKIDSNGRISASAGTGGIKIGDVSGASVNVTREVVSINWSDPADLEISGTLIATWAGTKVVVKFGAAPTDSSDGILIVDSKIRDQYSSAPLSYDRALYDSIWYFGFFPYTTDGVETKGTAISVTPLREVIDTVPSQNGTITYDSTEHTAVFNNYDETKMTAENITGTAADIYVAQFTPKHDYMWGDNTTLPKYVDWTIDTAVLSVPTITSSHTYNTTEQSATISSFDSRLITQSGDNIGTDAGDYTLTFTLKNTSSSKWEDNTTAPKNVVWSINKAPAFMTFNPNEITLDSENTSDSATLTASSGTATIQSYDSNLITPSFSEGVLSVSSPNQVSGDGVVTFNVNASDNYESGTVLYTVHCNFLAIVDWKDGSNKGTDEEIVAMVQAADAGEIELTDYWAVGDERTVSLAAMTTYPSKLNDTHVAQDTILVLVAADTGTNDRTNPCYNYQYVTATSGRTRPSFIFQQKQCLNEKGMIDSNYTNSATRGWDAAPRRTWCNDQYRAAFPATLLPAIKQVTVKSWTYGGTAQNSSDYFFLAAEYEIFGSTSYARSEESSNLCIWPHYSTSSNRIKQVDGSNSWWWLRSPYSSDSNHFCYVDSNGSAYCNRAGYTGGVAVCGCV